MKANDVDMGRKNRFPLDIDDLRERIENCRSEPWWGEMTLTAKIRTLILERLEELELGKGGKK